MTHTARLAFGEPCRETVQQVHTWTGVGNLPFRSTSFHVAWRWMEWCGGSKFNPANGLRDLGGKLYGNGWNAPTPNPTISSGSCQFDTQGPNLRTNPNPGLAGTFSWDKKNQKKIPMLGVGVQNGKLGSDPGEDSGLTGPVIPSISIHAGVRIAQVVTVVGVNPSTPFHPCPSRVEWCGPVE